MSAAEVYPVRVDASLDAPLSRWLWLVKWVLVIPHYFVLAFLWIGFLVLSVVAWVAILATGRYPRGIFEYNVDILRWTWRVQYYAAGAFGTSAIRHLPDRAGIWAARATGPGRQALTWQPRTGNWTVVAMNADGSRPVRVRVAVAATVPALPRVAGALLTAGALALIGAVTLIIVPARRAAPAMRMPARESGGQE